MPMRRSKNRPNNRWELGRVVLTGHEADDAVVVGTWPDGSRHELPLDVAQFRVCASELWRKCGTEF